MLKAQAKGMDLNLFPADQLVDGEGFIAEMLSGDEDDSGSSENETSANRTNVTAWTSEQRLEDQAVPEQETDPYVLVERYHELLPPLLCEQNFRQLLHTYFPQPTEHTAEEGEDGLFNTTLYLAVRQWVYDCIRVAQM